MLLVTSSLLYVVADEQTKEDNAFHSIPEAMYLAVLMLTGQGTPDGELSPPMRLVVVFTAFLSVPFFAVRTRAAPRPRMEDPNPNRNPLT